MPRDGSSAHAEMRPDGRWREWAVHRFLRSRGDAPEIEGILRAYGEVPPLTRRCAATRDERGLELLGSSAHAEMRPTCVRTAHRWSWFLRSRGDAPPCTIGESDAVMVPPLTRRCALLQAQRRAAAAGSSAHAEMRRSRRTRSALAGGFLRSRGDAPGQGPRHVITDGVPPLTRRCAREPSLRLRLERGSSAHAEMRPAAPPLPATGRWFLRSRGDAPPSIKMPLKTRGVPPLTRRCASFSDFRHIIGAGSSAHAEMRRRGSGSRWVRWRFLRSRGDAPRSDSPSSSSARVPPLTRRCANTSSAMAYLFLGSSAHAEMRRSSPRITRRRNWFLRSRGDAPTRSPPTVTAFGVPPLTRRCAHHHRSLAPHARGSSAHAEMRRHRRSRGRRRGGFLRSRGDAPDVRDYVASWSPVPPLTRRCAAERQHRESLRLGSSAHAEMRLKRPACAFAMIRFLRSRGDAPPTSSPGSSGSSVPPLTRRCALATAGVLAGLSGSSAHAEMRRGRSRTSSGTSWFLRSRGDAPVQVVTYAVLALVPPLTRRCAPLADPPRRRWYGSSAHAEMRPADGSPGDSVSGFLRSRGDAPRAKSVNRLKCRVPPLTRRCAAKRRGLAKWASGSSAHAEMRRAPR